MTLRANSPRRSTSPSLAAVVLVLSLLMVGARSGDRPPVDASLLAQPAGDVQEGENEARVVSEESLGGRVLELIIETPAFSEPTLTRVYLPVAYDEEPDRRWPVTYYVAGTNADVTRFEAFDGESATRAFPSIVVAPTANAGYWSDWYNFGAFGPPMYETFVIDQLLPLIDTRFRTNGRRAIFGESMGGFGAMKLAARHPDLFEAASSLSGAVDTNTPAMQAIVTATPTLQTAGPEAPDSIFGSRSTEEVRWRGSNPFDLAENLHAIDLQVRVGDAVPHASAPASSAECVNEQVVREASESFRARLEALGIAHVWELYPDSCHNSEVFNPQIRDSVVIFEEVFAQPRNVPDVVTHVSIEPRFSVWGWDVAADPARPLEFLRLEDAGPTGFTLAGSGTTAVTTPPLFAPHQEVLVDGEARTADAQGRVHLVVDLGPPNSAQQFTDGATTAVERRTVTLALPAVDIERYHGPGRVDTAAAISAARFEPGEDRTVVVAAAGDFPDALAGGPAAASLDAPILLTERDVLPTATRQEIERLRPDRIVILGGEAAVSAAVFDEMSELAGAGAERIGGPDRFATAGLVAERFFSGTGGTAFVTSGATFPDTVAAGPAAASVASPILLVGRDVIGDDTREQLTRLRPEEIVVVGGIDTVGAAVEAELSQLAGRVVRHAGPERIATAIAVSQASFTDSAATAYLTTAGDFPDGLAAAPAAAAERAPILLVGDTLSPEVVAELDRLAVRRIVILGGPAAISDQIVANLRTQLQP